MNLMGNMIQNGEFGMNAPMQQQSGFNPFQSNIVPFGNYMNTPPQQSYSYYNNNLYGQQQQPINNFVFQPVGGYQQQYNYNIGNNYSYQNPFGNTFSQQQPMQFGYNNYGYNNPYGYTGYTNYQPFYSPMMIDQYRQQQVELFKMKYRLANHYVGNEIDEDYLDKICNPQNPVNIKSEEEIKQENDFRFIQYVSNVANGNIQLQYKPKYQRYAEFIDLMSYNKHKELDHHSLCQFLEEDLWKLEREEWIRNNISTNRGRDFSKIYNSNDYNELLNLHNASTGSYVDQLLNTSRYDNNLDDFEVGVKMAFDRERRRKQILEGKVPTFISSDETQKRRHEWTQQIMNQIYSKGSGNNV